MDTGRPPATDIPSGMQSDGGLLFTIALRDDSAALARDVLWRAASGLLAIWLVLANILAFRSIALVRHEFQSESRPWLKGLVRAGDTASVVLLFYNVIWMAEVGLFLLALLWLLLQSVIMFAELLGFTAGRAV